MATKKVEYPDSTTDDQSIIDLADQLAPDPDMVFIGRGDEPIVFQWERDLARVADALERIATVMEKSGIGDYADEH